MNTIQYKDAQVKFPAEANGCKKLIAMLDVLRDVAKKFDGKTVNKRLDTAFRNACDNQAYLTFDRTSSTRRIKVTMQTAYINGVHVDNYENTLYGDYWRVYDGDVLNYGILCEQIESDKKYLEQRALDYIDAAVNYRVYREKMLKMEQAYKELYSKMPQALRPQRSYIEHPFNQYYE